MHFSVGVAILLICSTLLEAVPTPQIKSIPKQPWRPKAIREKEAAEAAARAAEEVARAAEEAARVSTEGTTEVAEDVTEILQGPIITALNEITEDTTLLAETVSDNNENDPSTVTQEPSDTNAIVSTTTTTQKNIVENSPLPTGETKSARKFVSSAGGKPEVTTQKTAAQITSVDGDETVCRLSLRGKPCACRFEKTCRCDCGRITAMKQDSAGNPGKSSRIRSHRIRFSKLNKPSTF
ncbi:hypothetical protein DAPPUDRAFT_326984 [Daphnia pulex]|uniref:Uncharacterized protein n=1 Tax=Daphnia pulex TaxID=6669 RepID=E9H9C9_DAPPU|nr:hypothetical protein DAPPUDRAFT_326984 [Daphnia pulex]|eukprot:EFX71600.1 hypothetical protein DAPPUDRAFT_326984 [Daphnia pulex]